MTLAERQVAERLQTYGARLPVTYTDTHQAHYALHDRLRHRTHRRRLVTVLAVAASVTLLISGLVLHNRTERSAPQPPATTNPQAPNGLPPTVDRLIGIWITHEEPIVLVRFGADGTYSYDGAGRLGTDAAIHGKYRVHGRTINFAPLGGSLCPARDPSASLAGLPQDGRLDMVISKPATTGACTDEVGAKSSLSRVSPQSPAGARITGDETGTRLVTAASQGQVFGIWLQQGTGRLLRLAASGTYAVDDGGELATAPDDTGTFALTGRGRLQLTSEDGSRECTPGDQTNWQRVRVTDTSLNVGAAQGTCPARADLAGSWVRLS